MDERGTIRDMLLAGVAVLAGLGIGLGAFALGPGLAPPLAAADAVVEVAAAVQ